MHRILLLINILVFTLSTNAQTAFDRLYASAEAFAANFPREKVYLHFDNTSYYQGDTIWYKAYLVTEHDRQPSKISKPLYVEFVDQLGNVMERQIVKMENGEGRGQISLSNAFFTGYYEVRAYTRWMLAFSKEPQYFSRTLPIFRKRVSTSDASRAIASYTMDENMKQRPKEKLKDLNLRFFPESGQLVKGLRTIVGFEAESKDSGLVDVQGVLLGANGQELMPVTTIHNGMGQFQYTPTDKPATLQVTYNNKIYKVKLPEAEDEGFTLNVNNRGSQLDITVQRSAGAPQEPLALFIFSHGSPCTYVPLSFKNNESEKVKVMTADMPEGVVRLSLVTEKGATVADRFCYIYPQAECKLEAKTDKRFYAPYEQAQCTFSLKDAEGKALEGVNMSVSIRDGMDNDYLAYDNNIMTDLLLTSELKGYIHQPGFYFVDQSASRRKMLDNLLLIRGWRKYNLAQAFGIENFTPRYMPETDLTLNGHVDSWWGKAQANIGITVIAQRDSLSIYGSCHADSLGDFSIPLDDFYGTMESLIQTKRDGKQFNRNSAVKLFRNFGPETRPLNFFETHPQWTEPFRDEKMEEEVMTRLDSISNVDWLRELDEVEITAKHKYRGKLQDTESFERDIVAYYNIRDYIDRMRDDGKVLADDFGYLLYTINPKVSRDGQKFGVTDLVYSANGQNIQYEYLTGMMDMVETAMFYIDRSGTFTYDFNDDFQVAKDDMKDVYSKRNEALDTINQAQLNKIFVRCALKMSPRWQPSKHYRPTHGIRKTDIQGYNEPAEFYSPYYRDALDAFNDRRRTLYWNPDLKTDENGEATISFCNAGNSTFLNISAETIVNGIPTALNPSIIP